jgi:hypothetical protein
MFKSSQVDLFRRVRGNRTEAIFAYRFRGFFLICADTIDRRLKMLEKVGIFGGGGR